MKFWSILVSLVCVLSLGAQDTLHILPDINAAPRERFADFKHAQIKLSFVPDSQKVIGEVTHTFSPLRVGLDSLYLDAPKIRVKKISYDGKELNYDSLKGGFTMRFDQKLDRLKDYKVTIEYEAYPRRGLYFIGWDDPKGISRKIIWTQGQGIDNRHWVPLFDDQADKIKTDVVVTFDASYEVLSNGRLISSMDDGSGKKLWHYQMDKPHSPYLMMLGIGDYNIHREESSSGIPLNNYIYSDWDDRYDYTYTYSKEIFDFLEDEIGVPYPWGSYSQIPVPDYLYGAMENTSATIFGDFFCQDSIGFADKNYVYVNGHELAHQWFGDLVTSRSGAHHWMHESFATYYHHLTVKQFFGDDLFQKMMRDNQNAAIAADMRNWRGIGHSRAGTERHYLKGSYVLKMLRYVCGDTLFRAGLQHYLKKFAFENATGSDMLSAFHEATGLSLDWFWNEWIYRGGMPQYDVEFVYNKKAKQHQFYVQQWQDTNEVLGLFKMPVWFEIHYKNGEVDRKQVWIENKRDTVSFERRKKDDIAFVLFDPNSEILKQVTFRRPKEMLIAQALKAPNMLDRRDALGALTYLPLSETEGVFKKSFEQEEFYWIKGLALAHMSKSPDYPVDLVKKAINSGDPKLQLYPLLVTDSIPDTLKTAYESLLEAQSYEVRKRALRMLCSNFPGEKFQYLDQLDWQFGTNGRDLRMTWLELSIEMGDSSRFEELVDYVSNSYEFITRSNAIRSLKHFNYCNETLVEYLVQGMNKANWKLAKDCRDYLIHCYKQEQYRDMIDQKLDTIVLTSDQRKRIRGYLEKALEKNKN